MSEEFVDNLNAAHPFIERVFMWVNSEGGLSTEDVVLDLRHVREAYLYCRSAVFNEAAIEHQHDICRRMAEQNKWSVRAVYSDNGVSARREHRDGLDAMLAALEDVEPGTTIVITADRSRLYRAGAWSRKLLSHLEKHGVALAFAHERVM